MELPDRYRRQFELEEEMVQLGHDAFMRDSMKNAERGQLSSTGGGEGYLAFAMGYTIKWIEDWVRHHSRPRKGRRNPALEPIKAVGPRVCTAIALRTCLDACARKESSYTQLVLKVGRAIEYEARYQAFKKANSRFFHKVLDRLNTVTHHRYHRHKVIVKAMKTGEIEWEPWDSATKARVGGVMVEAIQESTDMLDVTPKPGSIAKKKTVLIVNISDAAFTAIEQTEAARALLCPMYMPMIVPPADWEGPLGGGYISAAVPPLYLVKTPNRTYLKDLSRIPMPEVYDAINTLQRTPMRVNSWILEMFKEVSKLPGPVAGLPANELLPEPPKPPDIETNDIARKLWRDKAAEVWRRNYQTKSHKILYAQIESTADRFVGEEAIYYPYQMDFRGRVYTIPTGLHPQGNDLAKSLLEYAEGKPIETEEAASALFVHAANCYGLDKLSLDDRVKWVKDRIGMIAGCASDPVEKTAWMDADEPWQFLRACSEIVGFMSDGYGFVSHISVAMDATCSGLQHFSAMLLDQKGAEATNLVPAPTPRDIYADVAEAATKRLEAIATPKWTGNLPPFPSLKAVAEEAIAEKVIAWKEIAYPFMASAWLKYGVDRSTVKRCVMTLPYGATKFSHRTFILDHIEKRTKRGEEHPFDVLHKEAANFLADIVWEAIQDHVKVATDIMSWLRECARLASADNLPISWVTPCGFPVLQAYQRNRAKVVELSLGERQRVITLTETSGRIDAAKQANGFSPNFVHSCDAASLMKAVNRAAKQGVTGFTVIHDSFGCHAADAYTLGSAVRDTFVEMYTEQAVLADLHDELKLSLPADAKIPPLPPQGDLDLSQVAESLYFAS